jgi:hypothetical protein
VQHGRGLQCPLVPMRPVRIRAPCINHDLTVRTGLIARGGDDSLVHCYDTLYIIYMHYCILCRERREQHNNAIMYHQSAIQSCHAVQFTARARAGQHRRQDSKQPIVSAVAMRSNDPPELTSARACTARQADKESTRKKKKEEESQAGRVSSSYSPIAHSVRCVRIGGWVGVLY